MRLLVTVLAVLVGGSSGQQRYYGTGPLRPFAPYRYSTEREVSQGRISTGPVSSFESGSGNPCRPSPCGPNTRCTVSSVGIAQCRCIDNYVPDGNTIRGCKVQCNSNNDCPDDYRCQQNNCVRVCQASACGVNAKCTARNHVPICTCPEYYFGNPSIRCSVEEPEERVQAPAPYYGPCDGDPCGINAECSERGERPVCSCPFGYEGDPLTNCIRGQCTENNQCPGHQVCKRLKCIDPCQEGQVCGINADCRTKNHQPVCSCPRGYTGDAMSQCRVFRLEELCHPSPCGQNTNCRVDEAQERAVCSCIGNYIGDPLTGCTPECERDSDCNSRMACRSNICVNPCRDACGEGAYCDVRNHRAVCTCPEYYLGNAYSRCYPECTQHDDCPSTESCSKFTCIDPCVGACGTGANCKVIDHQPICSCPKTHTGDPFQNCRPFTDADYCNPNPCGTSADCQVGHSDDGEKKAVCTCPRGYIGNPLISCQKGECDTNMQCRDTEACYNYRCTTPCYTNTGDSVCGEAADCKVKNHVPVCACPRGYDGNPLERCYIDDRRYRKSRYSHGS